MSINNNLEPKIGDFYYHFKHNPELSIYNLCLQNYWTWNAY